jgi:hypothetical protein
MVLTNPAAPLSAVKSPSFDALNQDPPAKDAEFEDIEADDLKVDGGALVFVKDNAVKTVVAPHGYVHVQLLDDTPDS